MKLLSKFKQIGFLPICFYISLICVGAFHEFVAAIMGVALLCGLCYEIIKNKSLKFNFNLTSASVLVIVLFYALSVIWAVDSGSAFIGFIKYIPILAFILYVMQDKSLKEKMLCPLPYFSALTVLVSSALSLIPALHSSFTVSERLCGFFEYPNTFALFVLVCELCLLKKGNFKWYDILTLIVLIFGILFSGSRTVFVLAIASNIAFLFTIKNKTVKITVGAILIGIIALVGAFALISGAQIIDRFISISVKESTFVGRILYFYDALPVILKNPFGLGFRGYYYIQQEIQSGVYSVAFVHNDFLQLFLDIGWIPALLFIAAFFKSIFSKSTDVATKIILCVFFLHSSFDFDLQFISIFCLCLLFLDFESGKSFEIKSGIAALNFTAVVLALASFYMSAHLCLSHFGKFEAASTLYPYNTQNEIHILANTEDVDISKAKADSMLKQNSHITLCYSARSRYYYLKGDFAALINTKRATFEKFLFMYSEYEEYCYMLINGITLYEQAGDLKSAEICKKELLEVPSLLNSQKQRLSALGGMIKDQPETSLPKEITDYITELEKEDA